MRTLHRLATILGRLDVHRGARSVRLWYDPPKSLAALGVPSLRLELAPGGVVLRSALVCDPMGEEHLHGNLAAPFLGAVFFTAVDGCAVRVARAVCPHGEARELEVQVAFEGEEDGPFVSWNLWQSPDRWSADVSLQNGSLHVWNAAFGTAYHASTVIASQRVTLKFPEGDYEAVVSQEETTTLRPRWPGIWDRSRFTRVESKRGVPIPVKGVDETSISVFTGPMVSAHDAMAEFCDFIEATRLRFGGPSWRPKSVETIDTVLADLLGSADAIEFITPDSAVRAIRRLAAVGMPLEACGLPLHAVLHSYGLGEERTGKSSEVFRALCAACLKFSIDRETIAAASPAEAS